ncbi:MAG: host attachment protein [Gammaproteobacteria bacterium]|nr:host attachment protein [Gammaproteobacteria bacterium]
MPKVWVLVANHTCARVFKAEKGKTGGLNEIESLVYPEGRLNGRELLSDAPGRAFGGAGPGRHAMGNAKDIRHQGAEKFARDIAQILERGRRQGLFDKLYIVADPSMAGSLHLSMSAQTLATVAGEARKNLVSCNAEAIRTQLPTWL